MNANLWRWIGMAAGITCMALPGGAATTPAPVLEKPLAAAANDVAGEQPSSQHVWVPGHWRWQEGAYVWETGRWEVPPMTGVVWHAPEWRQQGLGFALREGYWAEPARPAATAGAGSAGDGSVRVSVPPPPLQAERIPGRPTGSHVWIPGYWAWADGRHVWTPGEWVLPPRAGLSWAPARWEARDGQYVLVQGYWRESGVLAPMPPPAAPAVVTTTPVVPQQITVVTPPPALRQEVVYARPTPNHVWVPGYWTWRNDRYVWMAGHYALPPRGRDRWVEPRWERRGSQYVFFDGHWR